MTDRPHRIDEAEAAALWRRAAELQAHAESRSRALAPAEGEGLSLEQVSAAAQEAGIAPDFVRVALAERRLPDADELREDRWSVRWARRLLDRVGAIEVSRALPAPPERTFDAVRAVLSRAPFEMEPEDGVGGDPLVDGVLVYRLASEGGSDFRSSLNWADVRVVLVTIRAEGAGTRLTLRAPLFRRGINLAATSTVMAGGAWSGFSLGTGVAALVAAPASLVALPVVAGAAAGGLAGVGLYRGFYRWARGGGENALKRLLQAVALHAHPASLPGDAASAALPPTAEEGGRGG